MAEPIVLIADDDENDVQFLRQALLEASPRLRVLDVADGQETLEYLQGHGKFNDRANYPFPDHLILDVKMPRRTGLEVLAWLRGRSDIGKLPVTVISGSQLPGDQQRAEALGAEYIVKPVEYAGLLGIARDFCRKAGIHVV